MRQQFGLRLAILSSFLCVTGVPFAKEPPVRSFDERLDTFVTLEIGRVSLEDLIADLEKQSGVSITLDDDALCNASVSRKTKIHSDKDTNPRPLKQFLAGALRPLNLSFQRRNSAEKGEYLEVVPYRIAIEDLNVPLRLRAKDTDGIVQFVCGAISPASWSDVGGPGEVAIDATGTTLTIKHEPRIIDDVRRLLRDTAAVTLETSHADDLVSTLDRCESFCVSRISANGDTRECSLTLGNLRAVRSVLIRAEKDMLNEKAVRPKDALYRFMFRANQDRGDRDHIQMRIELTNEAAFVSYGTPGDNMAIQFGGATRIRLINIAMAKEWATKEELYQRTSTHE